MAGLEKFRAYTNQLDSMVDLSYQIKINSDTDIIQASAMALYNGKMVCMSYLYRGEERFTIDTNIVLEILRQQIKL